MKKRSLGFSFIITGICLASSVLAAEKAQWGYSGPEGPEHWGELDPQFTVCSTGKNQSPVDLTGMVESELPPIVFNYQSGDNEILNNGHTIQVNYNLANTIRVDGQEFELKQFHFHSPSENTIEGQSFPMEAHFVHIDKGGNIAVVALLYKQGEPNVELEKSWALMPENSGDKKAIPRSISPNTLLPKIRDYYRFSGSLTTPPCTEGVLWLVMKNFNTASKEQIEKFSHTMHHPNNRPVQPLNGRLVLK